MKVIENSIQDNLTELFNQAETQGGLEYIFTLVRVNGLMFNNPDPILELRSKIEKYNSEVMQNSDILTIYCSLTECHEVLALIANLINCSVKKPFKSLPFHHLVKGDFPNFIYPTTSEIAHELIKLSNDEGKGNIASLIDEAYPDDILKICLSKDNSNDSERAFKVLKKCIGLLSILLDIYFNERLKYKNLPKYYKLPRFEVLELLLDDELGLNGFKIHFSNGSHAKFLRNKDSTECLNISPVDMRLNVGFIDDMKDEWRVGEQLLYEIGVTGRYNKFGEWKPLIYPGKTDHLEKEARKLSDDPDVQGALFYMMCTGYRVIEFVVRTEIELPIQNISYGEKFHLWKCPSLYSDESYRQNVIIYDGWLELESVAPEDIRSAIDTIGILLNRFAFTYNAFLNWRLKYTVILEGGGRAKPSEDDIKILEKMLFNFHSTADSMVLDAAIDWYNIGKSSHNIFTSFLCYYIALESVAIVVADGKASLDLSFSQKPKKDRKNERIACINDLHDRIYATEPIQFIKDAYFNCIYGLKRKTKEVVELVFGPEHNYIKALFQKRDGYSLSDIRGRLAHGDVTLLDRKDEMLVNSRVHEIEKISREFLTRILLSLKSTDSLPSWSQNFQVSFLTADPRTTLVASTDKMFPNNDWRIKPEWCD
jgi:hypothetical protein